MLGHPPHFDVDAMHGVDDAPRQAGAGAWTQAQTQADGGNDHDRNDDGEDVFGALPARQQQREYEYEYTVEMCTITSIAGLRGARWL